MARDQVQKHLDEGIALLQQGRLARALESLDSAAALDETNGVVQMLRGMALSQMGKLEEATAAFEAGTQLSPEDPKAFYNLGVHLSDLGQKPEALAAAQKAVELSPDYSEALTLVERLGGKVSRPASRSGGGQGATREGYALTSVHSLAFIEGLGKGWTVVGWVVVGLAMFVGIMRVVHNPLEVPSNVNDPNGRIGLKTDPLSMIVVFSYVISVLLSLVFLSLDMIDRRSRFIWILPMFACFICGFHAVPLGLYMLTSRRMEN